jgi:Na+/melibiose symporter-like transporter
MSGDKVAEKTELRSRLSYALTDGCGNLLYCIIGSFLLYFYTDVFGLSVAVTGTLLLATRLLDAIDAPLWGFIVDHTKTKYGQSRPYFLWLCVPFAVFMWLTFTTPDLSGTAKIAYAAVTYIAAGVIYTGIQTAITSILPNLSHNSEERVVLNTFRMVGGNVGAFICMTFTLPLVAYFGGGNDQLGFSMTLAFFGVIAAVLLLRAGQNAKVKGDAAIAMLSVGALALGYIIMNVFSTSANVSGDVCTTLFGSTSLLTLKADDVIMTAVFSLIVLVLFIIFYHRIFAVTFDESFAKATGIKVSAYQTLIAVIIAIVIVIGMDLVGSLLISALVIFPALSAMSVIKSFKGVVVFSAVLAVTCAVIGMFISILAKTPVGATIVATDIAAFIICSVAGRIKK